MFGFYADAGAGSRRRSGRAVARRPLSSPSSPDSRALSTSTDCFMSRPEMTASAIFEANSRIPGNDDALRAIRLFASKMADAVISGRDMKQSVDVDASRDGGDEGDDKGRRATPRPERRREPAPASA